MIQLFNIIKRLIKGSPLSPDKSKINPLLVNMQDVELSGPKPFVSIHVAIYNEKRVVERLIKACTIQDWEGNYEVVIADDSTDETTGIVKKTLINASYVIASEAKQSTSRHSELGSESGSRNEFGMTGDREEEIFVFTKPNAPTVKLIHRFSRAGFKGGALQKALENTSGRAQYVIILDADFVPYPDTIEQFVKTFQVLGKGGEAESKIAAVQGYQWHVLNKSENWITRGVRTEYAGSYVIERTSEQIYGGLKQIAGSVYAIRADILRKFGWGTSITEDFQLTLRLYEAGYKVVFTPYIQAPAEAVSTVKRLIRQRMRWAEGSSYNIKVMLPRILKSPYMTHAEKMEFIYFAFYYLQAAFLLVGTFAWFLSEAVLHAPLPFWTSALGWSLVFTNLFALPLMNIIGLFLEESEERDYIGILSFIALSYVVVPFQAYAAIKGFLEPVEGPWFRTPKTGVITDVIGRSRFGKFFGGLLGGRGNSAKSQEKEFSPADAGSNKKLAWSVVSAYNNFKSSRLGRQPPKYVGKVILACFLTAFVTINYLSFFASGKWKVHTKPVEVKVGEMKKAIPIPRISSAKALAQGGEGAGPLASILDPTVEQQINIMDQEYSTTSTSNTGNDGSLGIITYAGTGTSNYADPTVYFEAIIKNSNTANTTTVSLWNTVDGVVAGSVVSSTSATYVRVRSGAITPDASDDYTIAVRTSGGTAFVIAARLVVVQQDPSMITDTQTHVEVGNAETTTSTSAVFLANPKYFLYDDGAYDGTRNAYFEATIRGGLVGDAGVFATTDQAQFPVTIGRHFSAKATVGPSSYLYILGGGTGFSISYRSTVFKATINSTTGDIGAFATTSQGQLPLALYSGASISGTVGSSTYLYTIGGNNSSGSAQSTVFKATLNSTTGDVSSIATTSQGQLPGTLAGHKVNTFTIGSSTYIYAIGGTRSTVYRATLNSTTGDVSTWATTSQGQLPVSGGTSGSILTTLDSASYLHVFSEAGSSSTVYRATVNSINGNISIFATTSQNQSVTTQDNKEVISASDGVSTYVYEIGGCDTNFCTTFYSTVFKATINSTTGDMGAFATTSQYQLPAARLDFGAETHTAGSTYIYVLAGCENNCSTQRSTVYKSGLSAQTTTVDLYNRTDSAQVTESEISTTNQSWTRVRSGALTTNWDTTNDDEYEVRFKTSGGTAFMANAKVIITQTNTDGLTKFETYHQYLNTDPTAYVRAQTFATTSQFQLPAARSAHSTLSSTVGSSTYLYVIGGNTTSTVYKATLDTNSGDVSAFATTSQGQILQTLNYPAAVTTTIGSSTYVYVLGGITSSTNRSSVYKVTVDSTTGDLSTFTTTSQRQLLTTRRDGTAAVATVGSSTYIYFLGGDTSGTSMFSQVYKATLNSTTGDVEQPFATTNQGQLLAVRSGHSTVSATIGSSTYVYVLGGEINDTQSGQTNIWKSTVNGTTGDLSAFTATGQSTLPTATSEQDAVITNVGSQWQLYVIGGQSAGTEYSTVFKATLNATNGDVTTMATTDQAQMPVTVDEHTVNAVAVDSGTYIYVIGNSQGTGSGSAVYKSLLGSRFDYNNLYNSNNWVGGTFTYYHEATQRPLYPGSNASTKLTPDNLGEVTSGGGAAAVGPFATTSQGQLLSVLRSGGSAFQATGSSTYVYVLGGCNDTDGTCTQASTVYRATVNGTTGDVGTFATTTQRQLAVASCCHSVNSFKIGSSTYLYVFGGCTNSACSSLLSTVYRATLNSTTGDVMQAFLTTSQGQLIEVLRNQASVVRTVGSSTYAYVLGGCAAGCGTDANLRSTVYKATIGSATGSVGVLATTSQAQLPQTLNMRNLAIAGTIGPSSYLYVAGGCNVGTCGQVSTVYKSTFNGTTGDVGDFATTSQGQLPVAFNNHELVTSTVGSSTYLYVLGGCTAGNCSSTPLSTVYKATLNATTGDLSTFATTTQRQLPQALDFFHVNAGSFGSSSYLYILGGCNASTCGNQSTVYKSTLENGFARVRSGAITPATASGGGNIGVFATTSQGQLVAVSAQHTSVSSAIGSSTYLYVLGGTTGTGQSTVYKATLNTTSGDITTFSTTSQNQLPAARFAFSSLSSTIGTSTYLYALGGTNDGSTRHSTVYKATLNSSTGDVSAFATTTQGQLPGAREGHTGLASTVGSSTYVYFIGGTSNGTAYFSTVYKATLNSTTGDVSDFASTSQSQLPADRGYHNNVSYATGASNYIYVLGGTDGTSRQSTIYKATLNGSGDVGALSTTSQGQLPATLEDLSSVTSTVGSSTYVYVIGGTTGTRQSTVYKATLDSASGDVSTFATTSQGQLVTISSQHTTIASTLSSSTYIYVFGGSTGSVQSTVYKATLSGEGTEYDAVLSNSTTNGNWLVINAVSLNVPEWLLAFIPLGVFLPRVVKKLREGRPHS